MKSQSNAAGGPPEKPRYVTLNSPEHALLHAEDVREGGRPKASVDGGGFLFAGVLYPDAGDLDPTIQPRSKI